MERLVRWAAFGAVMVVLIVAMSRIGFAQLSTATVSGLVHDPTGAEVPGVSLTLRNVDTSVESKTVSNGAGAYSFLHIAPGRYTLESTAPGFASSKISPFALSVGQVAAIDVSLAVGATSEAVTVNGSVPELETSTAGLGTVITTRQVTDLPLNGRNFTQLLFLTPGVSAVNTSQNGSGWLTPVATSAQFTFPSINGMTNRSNYYLTDGMDNANAIVSTYTVPPIIDAIQEFKVVSHTDSAEFGTVTGGVVNVTTKSGTNNFHGSAWEFFRNDIFDARTYFLPKTANKQTYHQNQFGGSVGGPVWLPKLYNGRNKTFFFGAYQGFRYYRTSNTPIKVPTAAQLAGNLSDWPTQIYDPFTTRPDPSRPGQFIRDPFQGNRIPSNRIDSRMVAWANFIFPAAGPVIDNAGDNAIDTTPISQTQNEGTIRIDEKLGQNDSFFFRYSLLNSTKTASGGVPSLLNTLSQPGRNWGASYVHVFSPSLVVQGQFSKSTVQNLSSTLFTKSTTDIFNQVGFSSDYAGNFTAAAKGGNLLPGPTLPGYPGVSEAIADYTKASDNTQFSGTVTKTIGKHDIHVGAGYTAAGFAAPISQVTNGFAAQQTGDTNPADTINAGNPMASFLLNVPNNATRRNTDASIRPGGVFSAFVQDSWRTSTRLTINAGLRYDLTLIPPYGASDSVGQPGGIETGDVDFANGNYVLQKLPPPCTVRGHAPCIPSIMTDPTTGNIVACNPSTQSCMPPGTLPPHVVVDPRGKIPFNTYTNLGPRFGFAYQIDNKTVVRGGFGIAFDNWAAVTQTAQNIEGSWPDTGQLIANNLNQPTAAAPTPTLTAQNPLAGAGQFPAPTPFNQVNWFFDPHMKNPYSEQWNFGVQRTLGQSTTMSLNYVGSGSRRMDVGGYYNTALTPGPGNPRSRSLYPYMQATYYDRSTGSANYNAMHFSLDRRNSNGLSYNVAYTWSKAMSTGGDGWFGVEGTNPQDPYHPAAYGSYSITGFDATHMLAVNTVYQVPVGRGAKYSTGKGALDYILGNWQFNNIFTAHSGTPFTPTVSSDVANTGNVGYETLNLVGNPHLSNPTPAKWFNTAAYVVPPGFTFGTAGRNSLRGNGFWNLDFSVFRLFPVGEKRHIEFRAESFNLLNHAVFGIPIRDINQGQSFGTINSTANTARQLQLGGKFVF